MGTLQWQPRERAKDVGEDRRCEELGDGHHQQKPPTPLQQVICLHKQQFSPRVLSSQAVEEELRVKMEQQLCLNCQPLTSQHEL